MILESPNQGQGYIQGQDSVPGLGLGLPAPNTNSNPCQGIPRSCFLDPLPEECADIVSTMLNGQRLAVFSTAFHLRYNNHWLRLFKNSPLKASIYCCNVFKEIPLQPLAKMLILNASSIRVLSGDNGLPTPGVRENIYVRSYTLNNDNLNVLLIKLRQLIEG